MHVPAGGLAGGEEALQAVGRAVLIGAHAAHGIVLGRAHRDELVHRVDAEERLADLVHLAQLVPDVLLAEVADVEPEVVAVGRRHAEALAHVLGHAPRHHVAGGELGLFRLVVGHEPVFVLVEQGAAVAPAAFGHQNVGRHDAGRVELHGLHVAERHHAGVQGADEPAAVADHGVGGLAVDATETTRGNERGPGQIGGQLAGFEAPGNGAHAGGPVVDERDGLDLVHDVDAHLGGPVVERVKHAMPGAIGRVAGAPLGRAAEVARVDQSRVFGFFVGGKRLAALVIGLLAGHDPVPGHAPEGHLAHGDGRGVDEQPGHFLVAAPVRTLDRVREMHVRGIPFAHGRVAERGLHAALGGRGMGPAGRHDGQADDGESVVRGLDGHALAGQARADAKQVRLNDVHGGVLI